jgi:hypothetical protein
MIPAASDAAETTTDLVPEDSHLTVWAGAILAAVMLLSIGTPLIGTRVLFGTDMLQSYAPWNDQAPAGFRPHNPYEGDKVNAIMPMRAEFRGQLLAAHYPLWTTLASGGMPLGTLPHFGALSPLNLPSLLLPLWYGPAVTKLLEMAAAAGFTFLFLRRLGLGRPASLFGGLVFMNSGFLVGWTNWPQAQVGALIPALFWAVERAIQGRTLRTAAPVTVAAAAMIFAGFPAVTLMALGAAALYAFVRVISLEELDGKARVSLLAGLGAAVVLAVGVTALQLLPFREQLASIDQGYRRQAPQSHIPLRALVTLVFPNAFGSPVDYNYFGNRHIQRVGYQVTNYWEIQSFIGATAMLLVVVAAARFRKRPELVRGAGPYLWVGVAIATLLIYVGGHPLGLAQDLVPFFRTNFIGRLRSVWGLLLAALAAVGLESLSRPRNDRKESRGWTAFVWTMAVVSGLLLARAAWALAGEVGRRRYVALHALIPLIAGAGTLAAILLNERLHLLGRRPILWVAPLMIGIESVAFAAPYWPKTPKSLFYPPTPAHAFLEDHLGHDRLAASRTSMMPGTTTYYGLRSVTSHAFQDPGWVSLLNLANGGSTGRRGVYPHLGAREAVAESPTLDRMAVRYFVAAPDDGVFGRTVPTAVAHGRVDLNSNAPLLQTIPSASVRGVSLQVTGGLASLDPGARLSAEVLLPSGSVVTGGSLRIEAGSKPGTYVIPVAEVPSADQVGTLTVRVSLRSGTGHVTLAAGSDRRPSISMVLGGEDRLRLVFVQGVLIYERLDALPRIRWAGQAKVITEPSERLFVLASHVDPHVVVLDEPGPAGSGKGASLRVLQDGEDQLRARVSAAGDGYLVVADSMQQGWKAYLDGRSARLLPAEHAMVAVFVPAGVHTVTVRYDPQSWRRGRWISGFSVLTLLGVVFLPRRRRPRLT